MKNFYFKYERMISFAALVTGFTVDNLTIGRVDLLYGHVIILAHLLLTAACITLINARGAKIIPGKLRALGEQFAPIVLQFSFGGLFNAFFAFYAQSTPFGASTFFLVILAGLLVGNEFFRARYQRLAFQLGIFFIALFSYSALVIPTLSADMSPAIFVLSGLVSLIAVGLVILVLSFLIPVEIRGSGRLLLKSIIGIYVAFNYLYFANFIPPIPLALKEIGIYHSVERQPNGSYALTYEPAPWYQLFSQTSNVYHWTPGAPVYAFSAIFAPTHLSTDILHRWSYYDEREGEWIQSFVMRFPISGGRDKGYRGYTVKEQVFPGLWRVDVVTSRGQLLGRASLSIIASDSPPTLTTDTR